MDLSNLSIFNFAKDEIFYSIEQPPTIAKVKVKEGWYLKCQLVQAKKEIKYQWIVQSLDNSLANIGGYYDIIWLFGLLLISGYQSHKM